MSPLMNVRVRDGVCRCCVGGVSSNQLRLREMRQWERERVG